MEQREAQIVEDVLQGFLEAEDDCPAWDFFDDCMHSLSWLNDYEIYREASISFDEHVKQGLVKQTSQSNGVQLVFMAVDILLRKNLNNPLLSKSDRYILEHYLSLDQCEMLEVD